MHGCKNWKPRPKLIKAAGTDSQSGPMTNLQRRLKKLEGVLTDSLGLVPYTQKWLEYWDRQYFLYLTGQDQNAIWHSSIAAYRAVMKYGGENPDSLVGRFFAESEQVNVAARIA
jgi:hypothetical protein